MVSYDLNNINQIRENLVDFELEEDVSQRIKGLVDLFGTEVANVKVKNYKKERSANDGRWARKEPFKVTVFEKKEENLDMLRGLLNRLSTKNFDVQKDQIKIYIEEIMKESATTVNELLLSVIFNNGFYIELYVKLISWLIEEGTLQNDMLENFKTIYTELVENIEYVDPDEDYDRFCVINKTNDERKNLLSFLCYGIKEELYSFNEVHDVMKINFDKINVELDNRELVNVNEEILENIAVFVDTCKQYILKDVSKYLILKELESYSGYKTNQHKGFSSRMKFKSMDLLALLKK